MALVLPNSTPTAAQDEQQQQQVARLGQQGRATCRSPAREESSRVKMLLAGPQLLPIQRIVQTVRTARPLRMTAGMGAVVQLAVVCRHLHIDQAAVSCAPCIKHTGLNGRLAQRVSGRALSRAECLVR